MTDHDALGHSLILKKMENQAWPEKGSGVATYEPMLLGKIDVERLQTIQGSSIHHGPTWYGNILLQTNS
jgi:hypothetical protein